MNMVLRSMMKNLSNSTYKCVSDTHICRVIKKIEQYKNYLYRQNSCTRKAWEEMVETNASM